MKLDPDLLRALRNDKGLKQEALAQDVGCGLRTIQRAERGEPVRRHTALRIGQVLEVALDQLSVPKAVNPVEDEPKAPAGCVELVSCKSGRQLLQQVRGCFFLHREFDFDPAAKHRQAITRLGAFLDRNWIDPLKTKRSMFERLDLTVAEDFEALVEAGEVLEELSNVGLALLSGKYTCVYDRLVYDEDAMWEPRLDQGSAQYHTTMICVTDASRLIVRRYPEDHVDVKKSWPMAPFAETRI
jgi:transcriptional regulator with XRE-family HTH domain